MRIGIQNLRSVSFLLSMFILFFCAEKKLTTATIDRYSLVTRNNVVLTKPDTLGSLSVGNGEFAFTVDVSGLQTFYSEYENGIPLGTQTQWAWHSIPQKENYSVKDVAVEYPSCDNSKAPYPVQHSDGRAGEATRALRSNPHRLHLGMIGLILKKKDGNEVELHELSDIHQELDLWSGRIESSYTVEGVPVRVILYVHQQHDKIAAKIVSPLIDSGRLQVKVRFPYGKDCHVCPGYDWDSPRKHTSRLEQKSPYHAQITRMLDTTQYYVDVRWNNGGIREVSPHQFEIHPSNGNEFEFTVRFRQDGPDSEEGFLEVEQNNREHWKKFWTEGGAVDFSACKDPRAKELERRVVLSQYLTKIQGSGTLPPQETGLTMNSWYGKFHLEMHWWHAAHFALWDRTDLLERS
jgi:protein-glucosylgalactosylhydroxylysine glucosidase